MERNVEVVLEWPRNLRVHGSSTWLSIPPEFIRANKLKIGAAVKIELLTDKTLRIVPEVVE